MAEDTKTRLAKGKPLLEQAVRQYYCHDACACQYPRFIQLVGINSTDYGHSFKSVETEMLISLVKSFFNTEKRDIGKDNHNETWTCKRCGTEYVYGWSDFSIALDRQYLRLSKLKIPQQGKPTQHPIPLYMGLQGYSYPPKDEIQSVDFDTFAGYVLEG